MFQNHHHVCIKKYIICSPVDVSIVEIKQLCYGLSFQIHDNHTLRCAWKGSAWDVIGAEATSPPPEPQPPPPPNPLSAHGGGTSSPTSSKTSETCLEGEFKKTMMINYTLSYFA